MTAFEFEIEPKDAAGAFAVDKVNRFIIGAILNRVKKKQITKSELAQRLKLDKSSISRLLRGNQNLTSRSLGEILWALEYDFDLELIDERSRSTNTPNIFNSTPDPSEAKGNRVYQQNKTPSASTSSKNRNVIQVKLG
jgi:transcriptional regulator with XRE-family HTH domain